MFTGLVEQKGKIKQFDERDFGIRLTVSCVKNMELPALGASICISGCCLTVVQASLEENVVFLDFDVVKESLTCTTLGSLESGDVVNVEQAMRADTRLGGHFVQGHVDGIEHVLESESMEDGDIRFRFSMQIIDPDTVVPKGSITIDGVSLTVAAVGNNWFEVVLIPTTLQETTLGSIKVGSEVNIETDILTRTIVQVVRRMQSN